MTQDMGVSPSGPGSREPSPTVSAASAASIPDADDLDDFDDADDEDEFFDCHMMRDGSCGAAGSEWCEFECPMRRRFR